MLVTHEPATPRCGRISTNVGQQTQLKDLSIGGKILVGALLVTEVINKPMILEHPFLDSISGTSPPK